MPPIHPAIVHFPIALLVLSVFADLFGYIYNSESLKSAGLWSLAGATVGGTLAVAAGLYDMNREKIGEEAHERVHVHMKVGFVLLASMAALAFWRWAIYAIETSVMSEIYFVAAFFVLGLTLFQGWLGGELVFADGVGVAATGQGTKSPQKSQGSDTTAEDDGGGHQH